MRSELEALRVRDAEARRLAQVEFERPLVIEAGAGTGKTTTLVARVLAWCLGAGWARARADLAARGESDPADDRIAAIVLEGVVAITFTDAAAAEMAARVAQALGDLASGAPVRGLLVDLLPPAEVCAKRARALLTGLDRLVVRTIHAFCRRLLSQYPLEAGLHPAFEVDADQSGLEEAARESVEEILAQAYASCEMGDYLQLAAEGIGPAELCEAVASWIGNGGSSTDLRDDPYSPARMNALSDRLRDAAGRLCQAAGDAFVEAKRVDAALALLDAASIWAGGAAPAAAGAEQAGGECDDRLGWVQDLSSTARNKLERWARGRFTKGEAACLGGRQAKVSAAAHELQKLLAHIERLEPDRHARYRRVLLPLVSATESRLHRRGRISFSSLLLDARNLLRERPEICAAVRRSLRQLLVDEFQDTDPIQCEIVGLLALEGPAEDRPGLFVVGDPKQSIYGWRSADLAAYQAFVDQVAAAGGKICPLVVNFRSVPAILDEVERVLEPIMKPEPGLQPRFEPLLPCPEKTDQPGFDDGHHGPVEYWVSWAWKDDEPLPKTRSADATAIEARALARDLVRLHRTKRVRWSEIGLLFRSSTDLDLYLGALRDAGVPYQVQRDRSYYRRREVIEAAALVRAVLDPTDQVALVTWLRSAAVGVPDPALIPLWNHHLPALVARLPAGGLDALRQAVRAAAAEVPANVPGMERVADWPHSLIHALEQLSALRQEFETLPPDRFVDALRRRTALELTESARYLGAWRLANLDRFFRELHEALACGADPWAALRLLRRDVAESREAEAGRPRESIDDAVQVMTIHKAKGLDFTHTYVLQCHKESGAGDKRTKKRCALGRGEDGHTEYMLFGVPTPGFDIVEARAAQVGAGELVRLLYVALTRAKERVVVAGCWPLPKDAKAFGSAGSLVDLLAHRRDTPEDLLQLAEQLGDDADRIDAGGARWVWVGRLDGELEEIKAQRPPLPDLEGVKKTSAHRAALRQAATERMKQPWLESPSAAAHAQFDAGAARAASDASKPAPRGPTEGGAQVAMAVGTAVHAALEQWDLAAEPQAELKRRLAEGESLLHALLDSDQLPAARAALVDRMERLANGRLLERLRSVQVLARELPVLAPPSEAVGAMVGAIDLLYQDENGALVVADFKTDAVEPGPALDERAEVYRPQLEAYLRALVSALHPEPPPRAELWFLYADRIVPLPTRAEPPEGAHRARSARLVGSQPD